MSDTRTALVVGGNVRPIVPQNIEETFRLAGALSASGMAPSSLNSPEKVMVAILAGAELGLPPFQAIQSFAVINGRAVIWGDGMLAVVRANGVRVREWMKGEGDDLTAYCEAIRPDGEVIEREFSVADAKKAGLFGKAGPWQQYLKRMLAMRARSWCLRDGCADILRGMQMYEEAEDYVEAVAAEPRASRKPKADLAGKLSAPAPAETIAGQAATDLAKVDPKEADRPTSPAADTKTADAPSAETGQASQASATDASTASAAETSGPSTAQPSGGSATDEEKAARVAELQQTQSGGTGAVDAEFQDQETDPNAGPIPDNPLNKFWTDVPETAPWSGEGGVKGALAALYKTEAFTALSPEEQNAFRADVWALRGEGKVDFAADVTAFRCWMTTQVGAEGADAIEGTFRVLEAEPVYVRLPQPTRDTMTKVVAATVAALRAA